MNIVLDLSTILNTFAAAGILGIFREMYRMNERMSGMQAWANQHDQSDTDRFHDLRSQIAEFRGEARHD